MIRDMKYGIFITMRFKIAFFPRENVEDECRRIWGSNLENGKWPLIEEHENESIDKHIITNWNNEHVKKYWKEIYVSEI